MTRKRSLCLSENILKYLQMICMTEELHQSKWELGETEWIELTRADQC